MRVALNLQEFTERNNAGEKLREGYKIRYKIEGETEDSEIVCWYRQPNGIFLVAREHDIHGLISSIECDSENDAKLKMRFLVSRVVRELRAYRKMAYIESIES
jgi:hypothetical protein